MKRPQIAVTAIGMASAVGLNAVQSCAAVRAGIAGFGEWHEYFCLQEDGTPEPLICARVPVSEGGMDRVVRLTLMVMREAVQRSGMSRAQLSACALLVSWPQAFYEDSSAADGAGKLPTLLVEAGIAPAHPPTVYTGHAGALQAMQSAAEMLARGSVQQCIVVGADSFLNSRVLKHFDDMGRIKSDRHADAFIPGEGAAALVLETCEHANARRAAILAVFDVVGTAKETNSIVSGDPSSGTGLCRAVGTALAGPSNGAPAQWILADLNGESYRAREWGLCLARLQGMLNQVQWTWHPADCIGDVGAASGAMLVAFAARAFERGYAPARRALVWCASDGGDRAAVVLGDDQM